MKRIVEWMEWRGITLKDLAGAGVALGVIVAVTGFLLYGLVASLLG